MNALVELLIAQVTHMRGLYHFILTKIIPQVTEFIEAFLFTSAVKAKLVKDIWGWEEPSFERVFFFGSPSNQNQLPIPASFSEHRSVASNSSLQSWVTIC